MASITLQPVDRSRLQSLLTSQFYTIPQRPSPTTSFAGKTAVVTGANVGLGFECARQLLRLQLSHLILAVRSVKKGEDAAAVLRKDHPEAAVDVWHLDMASYESIQSFANRCSKLPHLDLAICNAALGGQPEVTKVPATGHEETFQVNYLSTALLSICLLPILARKRDADTPGRLTIVGSGNGVMSTFANRDAVPLIPSFDELPEWNIGVASERYAVTKTLLLMFAYKLADRVPANDVVVNVVDPGMVAGTQLIRNAPVSVQRAVAVLKFFAGRSLEQGAWTYIDAVAVKGKESHGSFVSDWKVSPLHPVMYSTSGQQTTERLWEETLEELAFTDVRKILESIRKADQRG